MRNKLFLFTLLLAALKMVLPFLFHHPAFELHRDEYLYYQQGQHLDWGYLENPPLIGVLAYLSSLPGGTFFWIKFWPALFGACTLLVTAGIVKELGGGLYALFIAALGLLFTAYLRIHFLFQPNFLDIFFWTWSVYFLLRFIHTQKPVYLYVLSAALALGWWSKYSILFFAAALFIALLLTPHRKLFFNKHFWMAAGMALLLITPNVYWQYQHNWPLLHHMTELQETQLKYINKSDFIKEQLLLLLPVLFVWAGGLIWLIKHNAYRIIAFTYFGVLVLLLLGSGKGYYALGTYPYAAGRGRRMAGANKHCKKMGAVCCRPYHPGTFASTCAGAASYAIASRHGTF